MNVRICAAFVKEPASPILTELLMYMVEQPVIFRDLAASSLLGFVIMKQGGHLLSPPPHANVERSNVTEAVTRSTVAQPDVSEILP
jgi:hypothetical protein